MNIIYVDNHILVADKPAPMITQPNFVDIVREWVKQEYKKPGNVFLEPIHRLDKCVTGLVLFARTSKALSRLQKAMRERAIHKTYFADVEGTPPESEGELTNILSHGSHRAHVTKTGKEAKLRYKVLSQENGISKLEIELLTGRYHQIRIQFAHIGCPIVGDKKYGSKTTSERIALHSGKLSFIHPVTKLPLSFEVDP